MEKIPEDLVNNSDLKNLSLMLNKYYNYDRPHERTRIKNISVITNDSVTKTHAITSKQNLINHFNNLFKYLFTCSENNKDDCKAISSFSDTFGKAFTFYTSTKEYYNKRDDNSKQLLASMLKFKDNAGNWIFYDKANNAPLSHEEKKNAITLLLCIIKFHDDEFNTQRTGKMDNILASYLSSIYISLIFFYDLTDRFNITLGSKESSNKEWKITTSKNPYELTQIEGLMGGKKIRSTHRIRRLHKTHRRNHGKTSRRKSSKPTTTRRQRRRPCRRCL